jgi:hypothetical protein
MRTHTVSTSDGQLDVRRVNGPHTWRRPDDAVEGATSAGRSAHATSGSAAATGSVNRCQTWGRDS